ncbi:MAG: sigma-70 family RNA polymerase sigma factor [Gammaproteobacteria bacterium]
MLSEEKIALESAAAQDLDARFRAPLMAFFLRRLHDHALAQDLTQETLLRLFVARQMTAIEKLDSYVFKIAINLLRDHKNVQSRAEPHVFVPIEVAAASEIEQQLVEYLSPERVLLSEDALAEVLRTLDELGQRTRDIFVLFRLERLKQKDIAALLGIGQSTVEKHVMKAMVHLAARNGGRMS